MAPLNDLASLPARLITGAQAYSVPSLPLGINGLKTFPVLPSVINELTWRAISHYLDVRLQADGTGDSSFWRGGR